MEVFSLLFSFFLLFVWFYFRSHLFPFSEFSFLTGMVFLLSLPLCYHVYQSPKLPWGLTLWIIRQVKSVGFVVVVVILDMVSP